MKKITPLLLCLFLASGAEAQTNIPAGVPLTATTLNNAFNNLNVGNLAQFQNGATFRSGTEVILGGMGVNPNDAVTVSQLTNLFINQYTVVATAGPLTGNINLVTAPASIDGISPATNACVLLTAETSAVTNGLWQYPGSGAAFTTRCSGTTTWAGIFGASVYTISGGTNYGATGWKSTVGATGTVGVTPITFALSSGGTIAAGTNLSFSGSTLNVINAPTFSGLITGSGGLAISSGASSLQALTATSLNGNSVPTASDTVALLSATQTLTNKSISGAEINSGVVSAAYGGTGITSLGTGVVAALGQPVTGSGSLVLGASNTTTVNSVSCTVGGSCTIPTVTPSITNGSTNIISGNLNGILYNNSGVLGNLVTSNSGVLVTGVSGIPSISSTLPGSLSIPSPTITGALNATGLVTSADIASSAFGTTAGTITQGGTTLLLTGGTLMATSGGTYQGMNTPSASQQAIFKFSDNGSEKWQLGKNTDNTFLLYNSTLGTPAFSVNPSNSALSFAASLIAPGLTSSPTVNWGGSSSTGSAALNPIYFAQTFTGSNTSTGASTNVNLNTWTINDGLAVPAGVYAGNGLYINDVIGATATGSRNAFRANVYAFTKPADPFVGGTSNPAYVGAFPTVQIGVNLGGTGTTYALSQGAAWAENPNVVCQSGATYLYSCQGVEIDLTAGGGSSMARKLGLDIVQANTSTVSGAVDDEAIMIGDQPAGASTAAHWQRIIALGDGGTAWPVSSTGTIMGAFSGFGTKTAAYGIDFNGVTFSGYAFRSTGFSVDGAGGIIGTSMGLSGAATFATAAAGTNTTQGATTAFVNTALGGTGSWTTYTPTIACSTGGTITASPSFGHYLKVYRHVSFSVNLAVATSSSCTGLINISLPFTTAAISQVFSGGETASTGQALWGVATSGASIMQVRFAGGSTIPSAPGMVIVISGDYESAS